MDDESDDDGKSIGFNDSSSVYQIRKILTSDQYTLGMNVSQYLESFHLQYRSLRESAALLPGPVRDYLRSYLPIDGRTNGFGERNSSCFQFRVQSWK